MGDPTKVQELEAHRENGRENFLLLISALIVRVQVFNVSANALQRIQKSEKAASLGSLPIHSAEVNLTPL